MVQIRIRKRFGIFVYEQAISTIVGVNIYQFFEKIRNFTESYFILFRFAISTKRNILFRSAHDFLFEYLIGNTEKCIAIKPCILSSVMQDSG